MPSETSPLLERFTRTVASFGEKTAIECAGESWTYNQLYEFTASAAHELQRTVAPGVPVGVSLTNGVRYPGLMLACLAAGCPCVPVNGNYPCDLGLVIDEQWTANLQPTDELTVRARSSDIAYILYTSGTSGQPRKGVFQNQLNLLQDVSEYIDAAQVSAEDHLSHVYSPPYIGAWRDVFGALLTGATLHTVELREHGFERLRSLLGRGEITILHAMPPVLRAFFRSLAATDRFSSLRLVYSAGDRLFKQDLELAWPHLPADALFYTGLGSTECSTLCREWLISSDTPIESDLVAVGYPIRGRLSRILDEDGRPVPAGKTGELVVTSPYLALGYWNNPELTVLRFRSYGQGPASFHTGDLGWEDERGLLHFVGRKDDQVKVRGFRVSIGEFEAKVRRCPPVADTAVVAYRRGNDQRLAAFVVPTHDSGEEQVRPALDLCAEGLLSQIHVVPVLAILPNGKRDRAALRAIAEAAPLDELATSAHDSVEAVVKHAWQKALGREVFDDHLTWKQAGGDSLGALELLIRLERVLCCRVPVEWLQGGETAASSLVARLHRLKVQQPSLPRPVSAPILFVVPGIAGPDLSLVSVARQLETVARVEMLSFPELGNLSEQRFENLVKRVVGAVQTSRGSAPTHLLGYSFGARIVFHVAALLESAGAPVQSVVLLDGPPEGMRRLLRQASSLPHRLTGALQRTRRPRTLLHAGLHRILASLILRGWTPPNAWCHFRAFASAVARIRLWSAAKVPLPRYAGLVHVFTTRDPLWRSLPRDLGWGRFAPRSTVVETQSATHKEVLDWPGLLPALRQIIRSGHTASDC